MKRAGNTLLTILLLLQGLSHAAHREEMRDIVSAHPVPILTGEFTSPDSPASLPTTTFFQETFTPNPWMIPDLVGRTEDPSLFSPPSRSLILPGRLLTTLHTTSDL